MGVLQQFEVPGAERSSFAPIEEYGRPDTSLYRDLCADSKAVVFDNLVTYPGKIRQGFTISAIDLCVRSVV